VSKLKPDRELVGLSNQARDACLEDASHAIDEALRAIRLKLESQAVTLGKGRAQDDYEDLKEEIHWYYNYVADPFLSDSPSFALRCYRHLDETLMVCEKLTGYRFHRGLMLYNTGLALLQMESYEQGVSNIELAYIEDTNVGHKGLAAITLEKIQEAYWEYCDSIIAKSPLTLNSTKANVTRLNDSERFRLLLIASRFGGRPKDLRGYIAKEALERNLNGIGKLVDSYLRRKISSNATGLTGLVADAFPLSVYSWKGSWDTWKRAIGPNYEGSSLDEAKITGILSDTATPFEARVFEMVCLMRNFTSHRFNDSSVMFQQPTYDSIYELCLLALFYTLDKIP
jgi:hypothetical protein